MQIVATAVIRFVWVFRTDWHFSSETGVRKKQNTSEGLNYLIETAHTFISCTNELIDSKKSMRATCGFQLREDLSRAQ